MSQGMVIALDLSIQVPTALVRVEEAGVGVGVEVGGVKQATKRDPVACFPLLSGFHAPPSTKGIAVAVVVAAATTATTTTTATATNGTL